MHRRRPSAPIFSTAADKCTTGLSFVGIDACPDVPRATTVTFTCRNFFARLHRDILHFAAFQHATFPPSFNA